MPACGFCWAQPQLPSTPQSSGALEVECENFLMLGSKLPHWQMGKLRLQEGRGLKSGASWSMPESRKTPTTQRTEGANGYGLCFVLST